MKGMILQQKFNYMKYVTICGLMMLAGCGKEVVEPQIPVSIPLEFSQKGIEIMPERWWTAFEDRRLEELINSALSGNFTLQVAWDRLAQAEAVARKSDSTLLPSVDISAGARRNRQDNDGSISYSSLYSAGVATSYEVDLWSRLGSSQRAARLDVEASRDAVDTAAITLSVSIANTWYQLGEAKELVRIAGAQTENNRQVLEIVTTQFSKGAASGADVFRQRQLVASTQGQVISAEETVQLLQHRLSVLTGKPPELAWQQTNIEFPELAQLPDAGVPSEVLWRRPDIRQLYHKVQAADQRLAAAVADQYPRISLSGGTQTSAVEVRDMFDNWLANLAANAVQPIFDGSLRKAEVQRQEALVSEAINNWAQAILSALQEVEGAFVQQQQQAKLLENLRLQLSLANETYQRNRENYTKGQGDYIRVLESLVSLQSLEREVLRAERTLVERRIDLYRSIAGGFELDRPERQQVNAKNEARNDSDMNIDNR